MLKSHLGKREFTVTEDHLKLLRRFNIRWRQGGYLGAPAVDEKRPYGDSDILQDVAEILGWDYDEEEGLPEAQSAEAIRLHQGMADVLEIIIHTESFTAGRYVQLGWGERWKRSND